MKYYLKDHVTDEMLQAVGFYKNDFKDNYRYTKRGEIIISKWDKRIDEHVYDMYSHSGYKGIDEYRHMVKKNIQDLIEKGYVEVRND